MLHTQKIIAKRLREILSSTGMTPLQLAEKLGVASATVYKLLVAERLASTPVLIKISEIFSVSIDYLVGQADTPAIENTPDVADVAYIIGNDKTLMKFFRTFISLGFDLQLILRNQADAMKKQQTELHNSLKKKLGW